MPASGKTIPTIQSPEGANAMKLINAVILSVLLLLFVACAHHVNDPADVQAIKQTMDDFAKALNASDANGVASFATEKTIWADNHAPVIIGREAIRKSHQSLFNESKTDLSTPVEDVRVVGDLAVARGTYTNKVTEKAEGVSSTTYSGSWTFAFARQNDGSWKWDWLVANSNQPSPGSTVSGEDEKALYQAENDWAQATLKKDVALLDKILAKEFQANYDTFVGNKKQILADLQSGREKVESNANREMRAFVFGDTGIVHGMAIVKASAGGKDTSGTWRYTDVFLKRDGRWQCVTGFSTKVQ